MSDIQVSDTAAVSAFLKELEQPLSLLGLADLSPPPAVAGRLLAFCHLLLKWNATLNLTGARSLRDLAHEHLSDAFVLSRLIELGSNVVDVGSGGGLPALPLAILRPDLNVTLVEPRTKRVAFLRTAVREVGVKSAVHAGKIEDWPSMANVAVSRATFPPEEWVPLALKLVGRSGTAYALLNDEWDPSIVPGYSPTGIHTYGLVRGQTRTVAWFTTP